jgi:predicted Zn-dependent peptidase
MPAVRSAAYTILIPAGAIHDPPDALGTAAVIAEWISRGAGGRDSKALLSALDELGLTHGESAQTVHVSLSGATIGPALPRALEILADVVRRPALEDADFEPVRALLLQSLRSIEDDPATLAAIALRAQHYPDPWGRPTQGTVASLERLTPELVRAHFHRVFRPAGAVLAVAGAIDWAEIQDLASRLLSDWPAQPQRPVALRERGPRRAHVDKETQQTQIVCAVPSVPLSHPTYYQARAAAGVLGGHSSSRLFTEVREKRGLCYAVHAAYESHREHAAIICQAGTAPDRAQETLDVTIAELKRLRAGGLAPDELDTMRAGLKSTLIMQQESSSARAAALAADWHLLGRVRPPDEIAARLDALTARSVSEYCASLDIDDITLLTLGPAPLRAGRELPELPSPTGYTP